jgi:hypothetical protein
MHIEHTFYSYRTNSMYREHILSVEDTFYMRKSQALSKGLVTST